MSKFRFDRFQIAPIPGMDVYLLEWARRVPVQIQKIAGRRRILINKLKLVRRMKVDGFAIGSDEVCLHCTKETGLYQETKKVPGGRYRKRICTRCFRSGRDLTSGVQEIL